MLAESDCAHRFLSAAALSTCHDVKAAQALSGFTSSIRTSPNASLMLCEAAAVTMQVTALEDPDNDATIMGLVSSELQALAKMYAAQVSFCYARRYAVSATVHTVVKSSSVNLQVML